MCLLALDSEGWNSSQVMEQKLSSPLRKHTLISVIKPMFLHNVFLFPDPLTAGHGHMQRISVTLVAQLDWCHCLVFCDCAYLPWQDHEELLPFWKSGQCVINFALTLTFMLGFHFYLLPL